MEYYAECTLKEAVEDIWKTGQNPGSSALSEVSGVRFSSGTMRGLLDDIRDFFEVVDDVYLDVPEEDLGIINVRLTENGEGYQAQRHEIEDWKEGAVRLWDVTYIVHVYERKPAPIQID